MAFTFHPYSHDWQTQKHKLVGQPSGSNVIEEGAASGRKRARKPKTRTGCKTCKIRRVKCDETQPSCQRCAKFGTTCDGYTHLKPSSSSSFNPLICLKILPKPPKPPKLYTLAPSSSRFESEQESRFFQLYYKEVATTLPGPYKTTLWDGLIPQMCEAEPFVRHAVIGIGALNEVYRDQQYQRRKQLSSVNQAHVLEDRSMMYEFALKEYGIALREMRRAIQKGRKDIRIALIACLLVFCFESLQGNPNSAIANAKSGLMLLQEYLAKRNPHCTATKLNPSYEGIETDIVNAFAGLDLNVLFFLDRRPENVHRAAVARFVGSVERMPEVFGTLDQCVAYWLLVQRRNYHFNKIVVEALKHPGGASGMQMPLREPDQLGSGPIDEGPFSTAVGESPPRSREALRMQMENYMEDVRRWSRACASIFAELEASGGKEQKAIMTILKIHSKLNHIDAAAEFMLEDTEYDAFLPEYTAIVELSEEVYPYLTQNSNSVFRFVLGIVNSLSAVGFRCRNSHIRGRAISLLQRGPYREGIWDALGLGKLTDWTRKVEEEGMDENGFIPEEKRVVLRLFDVDLKNKVALLGCKRASGKGQKFIRKEVVKWDYQIGSQFDTPKFDEDWRGSMEARRANDGNDCGLRLGKFAGDLGAYKDW